MCSMVNLLGFRALRTGPIVGVATVFLSLIAGISGSAWAEGTGTAPLTLERALELASAHNEDFEIAREQLAQARLVRDRAWAAVLPSVGFAGTFTHADREVAFNDRVLQRQDSLAGSLSATLTLIRGGIHANIAEANHAAAAAELGTRWTEVTLAFEVARAFYAALAADNLVTAAERTQQTAQEHLSAMEARRAVGEVLAIDEGRARLQVIEAQEQVTRARNVNANSIDYLSFLVGREPPLVIAAPSSEASEVDVESPSEHLENRLDIQAAARQIRAAELARTEAWLDYLPSLTLTGAYRVTQNTGWSGDPYSWQLLLTLDWVIYDGGLRRATRLERASQLNETRLRLERLDRSAHQQLRQARRNLETASVTVHTTEERRRLAEETRGQVLRRYRAGLATSLELVEADDDMSQAELALVAQRFQLTLARLTLLHEAGLDPLGREVEP